MSYKGIIAKIAVGGLGLVTDEDQTALPPNALIRASNVNMFYGHVEKDGGSYRWNRTALPAGINGFMDWWPNEALQRLVVSCKNGQIYRFRNIITSHVVTPTGDAPATLNVADRAIFVTGGNEAPNLPRKLFHFNGINPVQVIAADNSTRANMALPAVDWVDNNTYPTNGVIHRGRLWAFGNNHRIYASNVEDHEDFQTFGQVITQDIYPGEGERLISAFVFKSRLFVVKYPIGVYYLDDSDPSFNNWSFRKLTSSFGGASLNCMVPCMDDILVANAEGSISSMTATQALGGIETGDLLNSLRVLNYIRGESAQSISQDREALYYPDKKQVYFTYRSPTGVRPDRILAIDYSKQVPRVSWSDKDQPNCLGLMKDVRRVARPMYGAEDGFVYIMDQPDRRVGTQPYSGMFQTTHMDFANLGGALVDASKNDLAEKNKIFDFLEVTYIPTGNYNLTVDVFVDDRYVETLQFPLTSDTNTLDTFTLDTSRFGMEGSVSRRLPMHGFGRRISFKCSHSGVIGNFKISSLTVYFRPSGQNQKG